MKVILKNKKDYIKFSELRPGDTFIDPKFDGYDPEMKIEYKDVSIEFSETEETKEGFASVSLTTGDVFFYRDDFCVIPIKLKAVEE